MTKKIIIAAVVVALCAAGWTWGVHESDSPRGPAPDRSPEPVVPNVADATPSALEDPASPSDPAPAAGLAGIVVDANGREPVSGAKVVLLRPGSKADETVTAKDGTFSFAETPRRWTKVIVRAEGRADGLQLVAEPGDITIELGRGLTATGLLYRKGGAPVPGAVIEILDEYRMFFPIRSAVADGEGRYRISGLSRHPLTFRARSPDGTLRAAGHFVFPGTVRRKTEFRRSILLDAGSDLEVHVTVGNTDRPVVGADVIILTDADPILDSDRRIPLEMLAHAARGTTGADGRARFPAVPGGGLFCLVAAEGYALGGVHERNGHFGGQGRIWVPLSPGASVGGRVFRPDGTPADRAVVTASIGAPRRARSMFRRLPRCRLDLPPSMRLVRTTDSTGAYRFAHLPANGRVNLRVRGPRGGTLEKAVTLEPGEFRSGVDLALLGKVAVEVRVRTQCDGPAVGAKVCGKAVDKDGRVTVEVDGAGPASLMVHTRGYVTVGRMLPPPVRPGQSLTVVLRPVVPFAGRVVDERGKPVPKPVIRACVEKQTGEWGVSGQTLMSGEDGNFYCGGLPGVPIILHVRAPGFESTEFRISDPGAEEVTVTLRRNP